MMLAKLLLEGGNPSRSTSPPTTSTSRLRARGGRWCSPARPRGDPRPLVPGPHRDPRSTWTAPAGPVSTGTSRRSSRRSQPRESRATRRGAHAEEAAAAGAARERRRHRRGEEEAPDPAGKGLEELMLKVAETEERVGRDPRVPRSVRRGRRPGRAREVQASDAAAAGSRAHPLGLEASAGGLVRPMDRAAGPGYPRSAHPAVAGPGSHLHQLRFVSRRHSITMPIRPPPPAAPMRSVGPSFSEPHPIAACNSEDEGGNSDAFAVRNSGVALASRNSPLVGSGVWLRFLLRGRPGRDRRRLQPGRRHDRLHRHADQHGHHQPHDPRPRRIAFARQTLFMIVNEAADVRDWNGDTDVSDHVLLYVRPSESTPTFLDTVSSATSMARSAAPSCTPLRMRRRPRWRPTSASRRSRPTASPLGPRDDPDGTDPNNDGISYRVTGDDGDVVFLLADETPTT